MSTTLDYLSALIFGTSAGGVASSGETTSTLGQDPTDVRIPPDQNHTSHLQIARMKNLLLTITQFMKGGTRYQVLLQSANPFGVGEYGHYFDLNGAMWRVSNGSSFQLPYGGEQTVPAAATIALNPALGEVVRLTLSATAINAGGITISSPNPGQSFRLEAIQDGTGSRTLTQANFSASFVFAAGAYTVTATASKRDILTFVWDSVAAKYYEAARVVNL